MSDDAIRQGLELENKLTGYRGDQITGNVLVGVFGEGIAMGVLENHNGEQRATVLLSAQDVRKLRDYLSMALESWEG